MRILLLNQFYPPDPAPTGRLLRDVAEALAGQGHEVHVVCSAGAYEGGRAAAPAPACDGVRVHRVPATGLGREQAFGRLCDWGSYYLLAGLRTAMLPRPDSCLALTTPPFVGCLGAGLKQVRGSRLVLWTMDLWPEVAEATGALAPGGPTAAVLRRLARWMHARADAVIALGPTMARRLSDCGVPPDKVVTVPNWVPAEAVHPLQFGRWHLEDVAAPRGRFVVMYSGNMGVAHEFDTILAAARKLAAREDVVFVFVGSGRRRAEVVAQAGRLGLRNVTFLPPQPFGSLSALLGSADVQMVSLRERALGCVVPSKVYGIMAAARPGVVVGPPECEAADLLTKSEAGRVVWPGDADGLVAVLEELRARPDLAAAMGRAGRRYYEQHLGMARSVRTIVELLTAAPVSSR